MIFEQTERFERSLARLTPEVRARAKEALARFMDDPGHPSLRVKIVRGVKRPDRIWEARVDDFHRFTFDTYRDEEAGDTVYRFRNIGRHEITERNP